MFLSFVIYKASAFRQLFSICVPFSSASVCEHGESYSCSFLISLCGWLFCSLLCVGLCTFRCTATLLSPRTSIDSCSVSPSFTLCHSDIFSHPWVLSSLCLCVLVYLPALLFLPLPPLLVSEHCPPLLLHLWAQRQALLQPLQAPVDLDSQR